MKKETTMKDSTTLFDAVAGPFTVLDTETTGLTGEICEISVVGSDGKTLLDTLVKPSRPIPGDASAIHGITNGMVANAPTWPQIAPQVLEVIGLTNCIIYNAAFDTKMLLNSDRAWNLSLDWLTVADYHCAMLAYAEYFGDWDDWRGAYRWQRLENACRQQLLTVQNAHRALGDCFMTLALVKHMVANPKGISTK